MAFSQLLRELRDTIYRELLCPPQGIHLYCDRKRCSRLRKEAESKRVNDESEIGPEYDDCGGDTYDMASSMSPIPTAILYTNRQLYLEVSRVLYGSNRFTLDVPAGHAVQFLRTLPSALRSHIRHLAFTGSATSAEDYVGCRESWRPLCDFITQHMQIVSVTIQLPCDQAREIDKSKLSLLSPDVEWFWWPAVHNLTGMLMERKIQRLRLAYNDTYLRPGGDEDLEDYTAISILRTPHPQEERDRESREWCEYQEAIGDGRPPKFLSLTALRHDQERRRQRLDFVVSREDDSVGDIGTVLVLTRQTSVRKKQQPHDRIPAWPFPLGRG